MCQVNLNNGATDRHLWLWIVIVDMIIPIMLLAGTVCLMKNGGKCRFTAASCNAVTSPRFFGGKHYLMWKWFTVLISSLVWIKQMSWVFCTVVNGFSDTKIKTKIQHKLVVPNSSHPSSETRKLRIGKNKLHPSVWCCQCVQTGQLGQH